MLMSFSVQLQLQKIPGEELKPLHKILFGRPGNVGVHTSILQWLLQVYAQSWTQSFVFPFQASEVKRNIRLFNGFGVEKVCVAQNRSWDIRLGVWQVLEECLHENPSDNKCCPIWVSVTNDHLVVYSVKMASELNLWTTDNFAHQRESAATKWVQSATYNKQLYQKFQPPNF